VIRSRCDSAMSSRTLQIDALVSGDISTCGCRAWAEGGLDVRQHFLVPLASNELTTADASAVKASSTPTSLAGTYISLLCIRSEPVIVALRSRPSWLGSP
jgi:hypothetical protein